MEKTGIKIRDGWIKPDGEFIGVREKDELESHTSVVYKGFGLFIIDALRLGWVKVKDGYFIYYHTFEEKMKDLRPRVVVKEDGTMEARDG